MKFISTDSPVYRFMQRLFDVVKLNFLWLLFSLPIVTIGCSTIAAFNVAMKFVDETEGHIWHDFITAFKANWKQGIPMSFIFLIGITAVYLDFCLFSAAEDGTLFLIVGIIAAYVITLSLLYVFPLLSRYENTVMNSLKNSYRLSMKYFGRTLLLVFIVAFEIVIIIWNTTTLFVGLLIGPACIIYTISGTAMHIFRETEKIPGSISETNESNN